MREKGFTTVVFILLGLVLLILVGGGAYYFGAQKNSTSQQTQDNAVTNPTQSPQTDRTASWKTFTSNKKLFSFKYPDGWALTSAELDPNEPRMDLRKNQTNLTIRLFATKYEVEPSVIRSETITVGDKPMIFNYYTSSVTNQLSAYSQPQSNLPFNQINFYLDENSQTADLEELKVILSTFRFTD